jgi:sulfite reductase beta subunit-like hemoprotein/pyruvate/2-oxoacid:ferredoxin oxidoreductase alpha subunit/flavodoxin/pyruvate/2-oxoacid:ferredoxin oxidoreductase beta subunit
MSTTCFVDGATAASYVAFALSDQLLVSPVLPSSYVGEAAKRWAWRNSLGERTAVREFKEGEAGGVAFAELGKGQLVSTVTASQGLLFLNSAVHNCVRGALPLVMHVSAGPTFSPGTSNSIFGDHTDVMHLRSSGVSMLSSGSSQECHDLAVVAHTAALQASTPVLHFFDGFRTSREVTRAELLPPGALSRLLQERSTRDGLVHHRQRSADGGPAAALDDAALFAVFESAMDDLAPVLGRHYKPFEYTGAADATCVVVTMGAGAVVAQAAADILNSRGAKVGVLNVRLFKPWGADAFLAALPPTVASVAVLERTADATVAAGAQPLVMEVLAAVHADAEVGGALGELNVEGQSFGLGSEDFTPCDAIAVFEGLLGTTAPGGTGAAAAAASLQEGWLQCVFWGFAEDGVGAAAKGLLSSLVTGNGTVAVGAGGVAGAATAAQLHFGFGCAEADAGASALVANVHARFGFDGKPLAAPYLIGGGAADYVSCQSPTILEHFDVLHALKDGGVFVLNCSWHFQAQQWQWLPASVRSVLLSKNANFFAIDANAVAAAATAAAAADASADASRSRAGTSDISSSFSLGGGNGSSAWVPRPDLVMQILCELLSGYGATGSADFDFAAATGNAVGSGDSVVGSIGNVGTGGNTLEEDTFFGGGSDAGSVAGCSNTTIMRRYILQQLKMLSLVPVTAAALTMAAALPRQDGAVTSTSSHAPALPSMLDLPPHLLVQVTAAAAQETPYLRALNLVFGGAAHVLNTSGHLFSDNALHGYGEHVALEQRRAGLAARAATVLESVTAQAVLGEAVTAQLWAWVLDCADMGGAAGKIAAAAAAAGGGSSARRAASTVQGRAFGAAALQQALMEASADIEAAAAAAAARCITAPASDAAAQDSAAGADAARLLAQAFTAADENVARMPAEWIVGGDGWTYEVGYHGLEHVLQSGANVNLMVLQTEKLPPAGAGAAQQEAWRKKRDMGLQAMLMATQPSAKGGGGGSGAYVAAVAFGAGEVNDAQLCAALEEAAAFPGPSLVLAYCAADDQADFDAAAVLDSGAWPLYRWNPLNLAEGAVEDALLVDSAAVKAALETFVDVANVHGTVVNGFDAQVTQAANADGTAALPAQYELVQAALAAEEEKELAAVRAQFQKLTAGLGLGGGGGAAAGPLDPVRILFGSDGGQAQKAAGMIRDELQEGAEAAGRALEVTVEPASNCDVASLPSTKRLLVVISTAGQGDFPANAETFWEQLKEAAGSGLKLEATEFSVFAMGDRHYWPRPEDKRFFCMPGVELDKLLTDDCGAVRIAPMGIGDDQDEDKWATGFDKWAPAVCTALLGGGAKKEKKKKAPALTTEDVKQKSRFLRGTFAQSLADTSTGAIAHDDTVVSKFHGIYQQDDRDVRMQRQKEGLEKAFSFLIRVGVPGGICTPAQYLVMEGLADTHANGCLKLTTRQAFQLHGVLKSVLKQTVQLFNRAAMTSLAACGDVNRNVMCTPMPVQNACHADVDKVARALNAGLLPQTSAYHELWLDKVKAVDFKDQEPLYGRPTDKPGECQYLPRKFKIAVAIPPLNDTDVFAHDLGYIAIVAEDPSAAGRKALLGFNVTCGGGMGTTHNDKLTYPRLADIIGFCTPEQTLEVAKAVVEVQRDFGDRKVRKHARLKYTIEDRGIEWFKGEVFQRLGYALPAARPYEFKQSGDRYGWIKGEEGSWHYGVFVEHGRVIDAVAGKTAREESIFEGGAREEARPDEAAARVGRPDSRAGYRLKTGLREIMKIHTGDVRLTGNQGLILGNISAAQKPRVQALLREYGIENGEHASGLRAGSMACVALPTCGLALAESQRYLPDLVTALDETLEEVGLRHQSINIRMTGCPNGCARPFVGEIGFVGRAPGIYNMYLGAAHNGERLNKMYKEGLDHEAILGELRPMLRRFALEKRQDEHFGDFVIRVGIIAANTSVPTLVAPEKRSSGITFHEHTPIW